MEAQLLSCSCCAVGDEVLMPMVLLAFGLGILNVFLAELSS